MSASILPFIRPPQDALMSVHSKVPASAMTAGMLGTTRNGHAVQVTADGLLLTVGYVVMEASEVWLTNNKGQTAEALVLAHDYDSGLALLRPLQSLGLTYLDTAPIASVAIGDQLSILGSGDKKAFSVELYALEEFAGRWEYLLELAFYTLPLYDHWSGAALLNDAGKLVGIGSLALGLRGASGEIEPGNLFIPVELVMPYVENMRMFGQKPGKLRSWLGLMVEEQDSSIYVVGIYHDGPAFRAGIKPGDIIESVDQLPVSNLAVFFRTIWSYGAAGVALPLTIANGKVTREVILVTIDRNSFFMQHAGNPIN